MKKVFNNKEEKELVALLESRYGLAYSKKDKFEREENIILINNEPLFFFVQEKVAPTLKHILKNNFLKKITVDMGAVKFVASGADIMRPGITKIEDGIMKDDFVSVIDMNHSKPLAVGMALFSGEDMQAMASGKVIKNLHFVGDKVWSYN